MHDRLAAVCVLTQRPSSSLNRLMNASFATSASASVDVRFCVFSDETSERGESVVALDRPAAVSARPQYQCVAKIVAWLLHARRMRHAYVGWIDSDTWLQPARLATYLRGVRESLPAGTPQWIGVYEHWARFDADLLDGVGFSYGTNPHELEKAAALLYDDRAKRTREPSVPAARRERDRKRGSFPMVQGAITFYSRAALHVLLQHVAVAGPDRLWPVRTEGEPLPRVRTLPSGSTCTLPTDVGLGWLTTAAFANRSLHCVGMHHLVEAFVWPVFSKFSQPHTVSVHLAGKQAVATSVEHFTSRAAGQALTPPRLHCAASPWHHARTRQWQLCANVAPCDGFNATAFNLAFAPAAARNRSSAHVSSVWLPVGVRGECEAAARRGRRARAGARARERQR